MQVYTYTPPNKQRLDLVYKELTSRCAGHHVYAWVRTGSLDSPCVQHRITLDVWKNPAIPERLKPLYDQFYRGPDPNGYYQSLFFRRHWNRDLSEIYFPVVPKPRTQPPSRDLESKKTAISLTLTPESTHRIWEDVTQGHDDPPIVGAVTVENINQFYDPAWGPIYFITTRDLPVENYALYFENLPKFHYAVNGNMQPVVISRSEPETKVQDNILSLYTRIVRHQVWNETEFLDLSEIFNMLKPNFNVPFFRLITPKFNSGEPVMKLYQPVIDRFPQIKNRLYFWVEDRGMVYSNIIGRKRARGNFVESLMFKITLDVSQYSQVPYFATLTLFRHRVFDLRLSFSTLDHIDMNYLRLHVIPQVNRFVDHLNNLLSEIKLLPKSIPHISYSWDLVNCDALLERMDMVRTCEFQIRFPEIHLPIARVKSTLDQEFKHLFVAAPSPHIQTGEIVSYIYKGNSKFASPDNVLKMIDQNADTFINLYDRRDFIMNYFGFSEALAAYYTFLSTRDQQMRVYKAKRLDLTYVHLIYRRFQGYEVRVQHAIDFDEKEDIKSILSDAFSKTHANPFIGPTTNMYANLNLDLPFEDEGILPPEEEKEEEISLPSNVIVNENVPTSTPARPEEPFVDGASSRYALSQLQSADPDLFGKSSGFSRKCQSHSNRQPIVARPHEVMRSMQMYPGSVPNWIAYGSTPERAQSNVYFCPDVWCPVERVAMTREQYAAQGYKCPRGEPGILNYQSYYYNEYDDKGELVGKKRGYIDLYNERGTCIPCCFKIKPKKSSRCDAYNIPVIEAGAALPEESLDTNELKKYVIKSTYFPLPPTRIGLIPKPVSVLFNGAHTDNEIMKQGYINRRVDLFFRHGVNNHDILSVLFPEDDPTQILEELKSQIDLRNFVTLADGAVYRKYITQIWLDQAQRNLADGQTSLFNAYDDVFADGSPEHRKDVIAAFLLMHKTLSIHDSDIILTLVNETRLTPVSDIFALVFVNDPEKGIMYYKCSNTGLMKHQFFENVKIAIVYSKNGLFEPIIRTNLNDSGQIVFRQYFSSKERMLQHILDLFSKHCHRGDFRLLQENMLLAHLDQDAHIIIEGERYVNPYGLAKIQNYVFMTPHNLYLDSVPLPDYQKEFRENKRRAIKQILHDGHLQNLVHKLREDRLHNRLSRTQARAHLEGKLDGGLLTVIDEILDPHLPLNFTLRGSNRMYQTPFNLKSNLQITEDNTAVFTKSTVRHGLNNLLTKLRSKPQDNRVQIPINVSEIIPSPVPVVDPSHLVEAGILRAQGGYKYEILDPFGLFAHIYNLLNPQRNPKTGEDLEKIGSFPNNRQRTLIILATFTNVGLLEKKDRIQILHLDSLYDFTLILEHEMILLQNFQTGSLLFSLNEPELQSELIYQMIITKSRTDESPRGSSVH